MCLSCGCGEPQESHGDEANITMDKLQAAGDAAGITPQEALDNMRAGYLKIAEQS
ncbi:MAG: hypothetical protein ACM3WR_13680 [Solirubrobacterales bacterium]